MKSLHTALAAATTPFHENGDIDFKGLQSNIDWLASEGLRGVVACGGTGEFVSLGFEERKKVAERVMEQVNGRMAVVVGCADETTYNAVKLAKHAQSIGADGIMVIPSYYLKPSPEEVYEHFRAISKVGIPVVVYNNPGANGSDISPEQAARLLELPNVSWIKEATGDVRRVLQIKRQVGDTANVMCGCDEIICESIFNGANGWITITANALPGESQTIFDLCMEGEYEQAKKLFDRLWPLYHLCETASKNVQSIKYLLDKRGQCGGYSRLPRSPLTDEEKCYIDRLIEEAEIL